MSTVTLVAPTAGGFVDLGPSGMKSIGGDGLITVDTTQVDLAALLRGGFRYARTINGSTRVATPLAADLVSIVAAVLPANGALTIALQPGAPRKLQVRYVDDGTHHLTAGTLTLTGTDVRGNTVTEIISLILSASTTIKTANAYAHLTSAVIASLAGTGGTDTIGIGVAADLGLPLPQGFIGSDLVVFKENGGSGGVTDETVGTIDAVAGTIAPSAAPNGTNNYEFWWTVPVAD